MGTYQKDGSFAKVVFAQKCVNNLCMRLAWLQYFERRIGFYSLITWCFSKAYCSMARFTLHLASLSSQMHFSKHSRSWLSYSIVRGKQNPTG